VCGKERKEGRKEGKKMFGFGRLVVLSVHRLMVVPRMNGMQWARGIGSHVIGGGVGVIGGGVGVMREELREVAAWARRFKVDDLPRDKFTAAFSRSSGPGGQNVNKGKKGFIHSFHPSTVGTDRRAFPLLLFFHSEHKGRSPVFTPSPLDLCLEGFV